MPPPHYEDSLANSGVHRELVAILKEIRVITDKLRDDEAAPNTGGRSTADWLLHGSSISENDWKFAAMVLDRLCLITFTAFTVIATVAVLAAAPHVIVT